ncbi:MAG TPA: PfkB family carbohydrate kinase [Syntrophorhabdaceae bacterium]|nr:PfkB family carbohydrate kinase [Syntrophorhabdaceae bacterium]
MRKEPESGDLPYFVDHSAGKKICVVGDIIADIYIFGKPYRLSREAPVVVVKYEQSKIYPGSAGNTINNLASMGARVYPVGFIGSDSIGGKLMDFFYASENIDTVGIIRHTGETITKTRILAGDTHVSKQQVIRIDRDDHRKNTAKEKSLFMERLSAVTPHVDAIIVSDYGHGAVNNKVIQLMKDAANRTIVVGDSRYNLKKYTGLTIITPNESEAYALAGLPEDEPVEEVGKKVLSAMNLKALLITRGNKGMTLFLKDGGVHHIPISGKDDVADVTGAGDTVCATVALSLASGADFLDAARIANYAAGIVVMKRGTATVTVDELKKSIMNGGKI